MIFTATSCTKKDAEEDTATNPFFTEWTTPFGVPPFDKIKAEHYRPALDSGLKQHLAEIDAIINNPDEPTFENTILALENSGRLLHRVFLTFFNVNATDGCAEMKAIEAEYSPRLTAHNDNIYLDAQLFERVKAVNDNRETLGLDFDDLKLIENYYKVFVRNGIHLPDDKKVELKAINSRISELTTTFGQRVLACENAFRLNITDENDLAGLPETSINGAAEFAAREGKEGWVFSTSRADWTPFMQFAENRDLREKMFRAFINRGNNNDENDTKELIEEIAVLRVKKANILGFRTWADYVISDNMAKSSRTVIDLINQIARTTIPYARAEATELQNLINRLGHNITLEPWDWWFYTEKLREEKFGLDDQTIRSYFALENLKRGTFELANRLWGLQLRRVDNVPVYNEVVEVYEVLNPDGSHLGVVYFDWHPRPTKRGGAWMSSIKRQYHVNGERSHPVVTNVSNYTPPQGGAPALLSIDEAGTLLHEFGHALHGLFANTKYRSTSGTSVPRDFVELPSQIMENWLLEPEFLKKFARHYQTGEVISDELIEKLQASARFNQGWITMEHMASAVIDLDWHTITDTNRRNAVDFQNASMRRMGLLREIAPRHSSWHFRHIWGSEFGYSAAYYSYTWSGVLDACAYQAFVETGDIFNTEVAARFRDHILMMGGSVDADVLYRRFRGHDPRPDAYFARKGFTRR
jgi:peptidyl-dipeptidase Dcp